MALSSAGPLPQRSAATSTATTSVSAAVVRFTCAGMKTSRKTAAATVAAAERYFHGLASCAAIATLRFFLNNAGLLDVELLLMQRHVGLHDHRALGQLFHLLQPARARGFQRLADLGIHAQHDVRLVHRLRHLAHLDVDLVADGRHRLDQPRAGAIDARLAEGPLERLFYALARDRDQA